MSAMSGSNTYSLRSHGDLPSGNVHPDVLPGIPYAQAKHFVKWTGKGPMTSMAHSDFASAAPPVESRGQIIEPQDKGHSERNGPDPSFRSDEGDHDLEAQQIALREIEEKYLKQKALVHNLVLAKKEKLTKSASPAQTGNSTHKKSTPVSAVSKMSGCTSHRSLSRLAPDSYLARTLMNLGADDPSDSSASPSGSDDDHPASGMNQREFSKSTRSSIRQNDYGSRKSRLKPIPPKEYDGTPDSRAFNRFVTEGTTYVIDGRVRKDRQIFVLSYYLTGIAYDFYVQKVSMNFSQWNLRQFFEQLFDYCFPVNYRAEQRNKLEHCHQKDRKVSAYVHELEELYNMIGTTDYRGKVVKLWDGLRPSIQKELYRSGYNPDLSSWDDVVHYAEIIELSHGIAHGRSQDDTDNDERSDIYDSDHSEGSNLTDINHPLSESAESWESDQETSVSSEEDQNDNKTRYTTHRSSSDEDASRNDSDTPKYRDNKASNTLGKAKEPSSKDTRRPKRGYVARNCTEESAVESDSFERTDITSDGGRKSQRH